jgi:hypothetical protein
MVSVSLRGTAVNDAAQSVLTVPNVTAAAGSLLVLSLEFDTPDIDSFPTSVVWGSQSFNLTNVFGGGVGSVPVQFFVVALTVTTGGTHNLVITFGNLQPTVQVAVVFETTEMTLANDVPLDFGTGSSESTTYTFSDGGAQAHYFMALQAVGGPKTDVPGSWIGSTILEVREGSLTLPPTLSVAWYNAHTSSGITYGKSGHTSRNWGLAGVVFRVPTAHIPGVLTTYDFAEHSREIIAPKLTPEQEQAIWRGDNRYFPGMIPGGTP